MPKSKLAKVVCVCCTSRIPKGDAVPQEDNTFLCVACESEAWEHQQERWEAEEWALVSRVVDSRRRIA